MNLCLNESSESIKLLIHKDSPNVHTIHPKCDIGNINTTESLHKHSVVSFMNESALRNESRESIKLLIHKDSHCLSPNVHTIHPKCDISHVQYYLGQIGWILCTLGRRDMLCPDMKPFEESIELMIQ